MTADYALFCINAGVHSTRSKWTDPEMSRSSTEFGKSKKGIALMDNGVLHFVWLLQSLILAIRDQ